MVRDAAGTPSLPETVLALGLVRPRTELRHWMAQQGEPAYRGSQVGEWVFRHGVTDPLAMTNLPARLRESLRASAWQAQLRVLAVQSDADGTRKAVLALEGAGLAPARVETVLIPDGDRLTVCVSTQAGCAVGCPFCATGQVGLQRNLTAAEIAGQLLWVRAHVGRWPTHVVFMGMGEPMANWRAVRQSIDLIRPPEGFGIGVRRLTVSTSGVVPGIRALAAEPTLEVNLAISLHAPDDQLRDRLVPLNRRWPLSELMDAVRAYVEATRRRVSFEYVMLGGINDGPLEARRLAALLNGLLCHVNLIPYNPVSGLPFEPSSPSAVRRFRAILAEAGIPVTLRRPRGRAIDAACGQLGARWERRRLVEVSAGRDGLGE